LVFVFSSSLKSLKGFSFVKIRAGVLVREDQGALAAGVIVQGSHAAADLVQGVLDQRVAGHLHPGGAAEVPPDLLDLRGRDAVHIHNADEGVLLDTALDLLYFFLLPPGQVVRIEYH